MIIKKVNALQKGIVFEVVYKSAWYMLTINTEQTWFVLDKQEQANVVSWTGLKDEKLINQLNRAWKKAQFLG